MKKGLSLRMRLTLITSLLLTALCITVTMFSIYNVKDSTITIDFHGQSQGTDSNLDMPMLEPQLDKLDLSEFSGIPNQYFVDISTYSYTSILFMAVAIVVGSVLMYFISGIILKPLGHLSDTIASVDEDALFIRINEFQSGDELTILANSFNQMLERLENGFSREQRFSSAAAHEMKTPLTVIKTNLDVLQLDENPSQEDCMESIAVVRTQTVRMIQLIQDLLDITTAGSCERNETVRIDLILKEICSELSAQAIEKHIDFCLDTAPFTIKANRIMLKHAISNIAENAIKYNIPNGFLNCSLKAEQGGYTITIIDNGIGITSEDTPYIFEPFYRGDKSRNRKTGGCGLGLAIAKEIINHHGGTITYTANIPQGSIFTIHLS